MNFGNQNKGSYTIVPEEFRHLRFKFRVGMDADACILRFNSETIHTIKYLTGRKLEKGQSLFNYLEEHEILFFRQNFKLIKNGEYITRIKKFRNPDQRIFYFQVLFSLEFNRDNAVSCIIVEGFNITGQNSFESEKAKISHNLAASSGRDNFNLVCRFTFDGTLTYYSSEFKKTFIKELDPISSVKFTDYLDLGECSEFLLKLKSISQESPTSFWMHKSNERLSEPFFQWIIFGLFKDKPEASEFVAFGKNVSEDRKREIETILYKNKIEAILKALPDMIFIFNSSGIVLDCISQEQTLLLAKTEQVKGFHINNFFSKKISDEILAVIKECLKTKETINYLYTIEIEGNTYTFEARHVPFGNNKVLSISRNITEKVKAEEELIKSEEKFRLISNQTSDGIIVITNHVIEFASDSYLRILGYGLDEEIGRNEDSIFELIHPEDRGKVKDKIYQAISDKLPDVTYLYRARAKNGHYIWREDHATLIYNSQNVYYKAYVISRDVTERIHFQEQLCINEERLRMVIEISDAAVWDWQIKSNRIIHNAIWCNHLGLDTDYQEHDLEFFSSLIHPEDREKVFSRIQDCLNNGKPYVSEHRLVKKDGEIIWVIDRGNIVKRDDKGNPIRMLGSFINITSNKEQNQRISILERAIEQIPNVLVITDAKGIVEYVNPQFTISTGYLKNEIIGQNVNLLKSGNHATEYYKELWETIKSGKTWRGDFHNKDKNGKLYWERAIIFPVFNEICEIDHFIAIKEDNTIEKELWNQLYDAKLKAEESDKLKSAFLANISHEIRTPMNGLLGFISFLTQKSVSEEEKAKFVSIIHKSSQKLLTIVDDLIEISKIETGQLTLFRDAVNLNDLFTEIRDKYMEDINKKSIQVYLDLSRPYEYAFVISDLSKLIRILDNLFNNSVKFSKSGGIIRAGYSIKNNNLEFFIQDTGIGISEENKELIFNNFRQVETGVTRNYGGIGLGLSIAKGYINYLKGNIWINSELGKGTHIVLSLPFIPYGPTISKEPVKQENKILSIKVLIVDDESINIEYLSNILENYIPEIFTARNGLEALKLMDKDPVPLIFMDIKMPEMDGVEALRLIKSEHPQTFIIAITAYATEGDRESYLNLGFDDYISKPFSIEEIQKRITKYINVNLSK